MLSPVEVQICNELYINHLGRRCCSTRSGDGCGQAAELTCAAVWAEPTVEAFSIEIDPAPAASAAATDGGAPCVTRIYAEGICCPSKVPLIRRILEPMAGVTQARSC